MNIISCHFSDFYEMSNLNFAFINFICEIIIKGEYYAN